MRNPRNLLSQGRNITGLAIAAMMTLTPTKSHAAELWDAELLGITIGPPAGALPPPGVYGQLDNYFASYKMHDNNGNIVPNAQITALIETPLVMWVPGIKILGANYAVAIAQPVVWNSYQPFQREFGGGGGNIGTFNTVVLPYLLSWSLPEHFFVRNSLAVFLPDGSSTMKSFYTGHLKNGGAPSANDYTTVQPGLGISWLYNGWNISANASISVNVTNGYNDYHTAPLFHADYTIAKTIGRLTVGFGGSENNFMNSDSEHGVTLPGTKRIGYSVGPLVGYQFPDGLGLTLICNRSLYMQNDIGGTSIDLRLTTAF